MNTTNNNTLPAINENRSISPTRQRPEMQMCEARGWEVGARCAGRQPRGTHDHNSHAPLRWVCGCGGPSVTAVSLSRGWDGPPRVSGGPKHPSTRRLPCSCVMHSSSLKGALATGGLIHNGGQGSEGGARSRARLLTSAAHRLTSWWRRAAAAAPRRWGAAA